MEKISKLIRCAAKRWAEKRKNTDSPEQKTVETPERIETQVEKTRLQEHHKSEIEKLRNGCQAEIDKAIHRVEAIERQSKEKDTVIDKQRKQISLLDRKANPPALQPFVRCRTCPPQCTELSKSVAPHPDTGR